MNPMREIRLEKVTLNVGAGEAGEKLERSKMMIEKIAEGAKVVVTHTHKRSTFGVAKNRPIGVKVTLRGEKAFEILQKLVKANDGKLKASQFDSNGNFSFGIKEYIDIPGMKYDPDIGILGFDVCVTLERPGFRVKRRRFRRSQVGRSHRITREEAMEWAASNLGVKIEGA